MTETLMDPPPTPPPPADPRRLVRDPDDQVVAGVCAAFGRYTDTDPVLWRVAVAVLAVLGGAGIALYGFAWLLVPRRGQPESVAERTLRRPDRSVRVVGVIGLVLLAIVLLALLDNGAVVAAVAVLGGIGYLVSRERREPRPQVQPHAPVATPVHLDPPPPRERSPLGGVTLSLAILLAGALLVVREAGAEQVTVSRVLAAVLLTLGGGLLVGTWWGRARWLLPVGILVALALAGSAAASRNSFEGGVGERSWRAVDGGSYRLGAGEATLDLRGLRGLDGAQVEARVGFGELTVLVPRGMSVAVTAESRLGELDAPGRDAFDGEGPLDEQFVVGSADDVTVTLDLEVGVGEIEVRYA